MLLLLISCFSFMFVLKSLLPMPKMIVDMRILSIFYWVELCKSIVCFMQKNGFIFGVVKLRSFNLRPMMNVPRVYEYVELEGEGLSLLDLPDLALDLILDQLSPRELCIMAGVCSELRAKCRSNHMWEKHMKCKWGRVIGNVALVQWHEYMAHNMRKYYLNGGENRGVFWSFFRHWPLSLIVRPMVRGRRSEVCLPPDSIMGWYLSLESGEFWFPAQVYNRENGHDGFVLSCYDAKLSYNSKSDTFQARYNGRQIVEEDITWDRIRAPPVDNPPYELHVSDSLNDLKPGDHFEIQWRRNRDFPYGWWYGVVGHVDSCTRAGNHCDCGDNDTVILEFNQYSHDSRWRRMTVNRKSHREEGNEGDGFHGGIRKIYSEEEIAIWKSLWPTKVLN